MLPKPFSDMDSGNVQRTFQHLVFFPSWHLRWSPLCLSVFFILRLLDSFLLFSFDTSTYSLPELFPAVFSQRLPQTYSRHFPKVAGRTSSGKTSRVTDWDICFLPSSPSGKFQENLESSMHFENQLKSFFSSLYLVKGKWRIISLKIIYFLLQIYIYILVSRLFHDLCDSSCNSFGVCSFGINYSFSIHFN